MSDGLAHSSGSGNGSGYKKPGDLSEKNRKIREKQIESILEIWNLARIEDFFPDKIRPQTLGNSSVSHIYMVSKRKSLLAARDMFLATCKNKSGRAVPCRFTHCNEIAGAVMKDINDAKDSPEKKKRVTTPSDADGDQSRKKLKQAISVPRVRGLINPGNNLGGHLGSSSSRPIDLDASGDIDMHTDSRENLKTSNGRLVSQKENQHPRKSRPGDSCNHRRNKKQRSKYLTGATIDEINGAISIALPVRQKKKLVRAADLKAKQDSVDGSHLKTASSDDASHMPMDDLLESGPEVLVGEADDDAFFKLQKVMEAFNGPHHIISSKLLEPAFVPDIKSMADAQSLEALNTIIVDISQRGSLLPEQDRRRKYQSQPISERKAKPPRCFKSASPPRRRISLVTPAAEMTHTMSSKAGPVADEPPSLFDLGTVLLPAVLQEKMASMNDASGTPEIHRPDEAEEAFVSYIGAPAAPMVSTLKVPTASVAKMVFAPQQNASTPDDQKKPSAHGEESSTPDNGEKFFVAASIITSRTAPSVDSELPVPVSKVLLPSINENTKALAPRTPKEVQHDRHQKDVAAKADITSVRSHIKMTVSLLNTSTNEDLKDDLKRALSTAARCYNAEISVIIKQYGLGDNASAAIP